jgi:methyl-accepting chemotaxis protein
MTSIRWFRGIRGKLLIMGIVPAVLIVLNSFIYKSGIDELSESSRHSHQVRSRQIEVIGDLDGSIHALARWLWITYGHEGQIQARNQFIKRSEDSIERIDQLIKDYLKIPQNDSKIQSNFEKIQQEWILAKAGALESISYLKLHDKVNNEAAKTALLQKTITHMIIITSNFKEIKDYIHKIVEQEALAVDVLISNINKKTIVLILISSIGLVAFALKFSLDLSNNLKQLASSLGNINHELNLSVGKIAESSQKLSEATTEQSSSLGQTAASMEEISAMVSKNSENAKQTADASKESQDKVEQGQSVMKKMVDAMSEINMSNEEIVKHINQSNERMAEIVDVIHEITSTTQVINDIVFQTKLLSFNASVEAARAGEHGKGFAVVAEEIGNLASMSGSTSKKISEMLDQSTQRVDSIVKETKAKVDQLVLVGKEKVDAGVLITTECRDVLKEITVNVSTVSENAHGISVSSEQQSRGINEIKKAMEQLDTVTQSNSLVSEKTANVATELSHQAETMHGIVQQLLKTVEG